MSILVPPLRLAYFPVPKNACSTLKILFYRINTGEIWSSARNGGQPIHRTKGYRTLKFSAARARVPEGYQTLAVVRDPIDRFLSAYFNKVVDERGATQAAMAPGAVLPESFDEFLDRIEELRHANYQIRQHTRPQTDFLGPDPGYFSFVFRLEANAGLRNWLRDRIGAPPKLRHVNRSQRSFGRERLTPAQLARLRDLYRADFAFIAAMRPAPAGHPPAEGPAPPG
jgi:Sulfotransferase family